MASSNDAIREDGATRSGQGRWIDFSGIENPFGTPSSMTGALVAALRDGKISDRPDRDALALRRALSSTLLLPDRSFLVGGSVSDMIRAVAQAFEPGTVGITAPCPLEYVLAVANAGHRIERIPAPSNLVTPPLGDLPQQDGRLTAALLANPGFPSSRLLPEAVLLSYLEACDWVVVDERSIELSLSGKSIAPLVESYRNLIVIQSFAEQYALSGAPVSYCIGHPDTVAEIARFYDDSSVSLLPEALAEPSVREYPKLADVRGFLAGEIPWMQTMLSLVPGIEIFPAEANYVMCSLSADRLAGDRVSDLDDLISRLSDARCIVRKLEGVSGVADQRSFCVSVRTRPENERLIEALRALLA